MRQTECSLVIKDRSIARVAALIPEEPERLPWLPSPYLQGRANMKEANMSQESIYVGIDVSKEQVDVAVRPLIEAGACPTTKPASMTW